MILLDSVTREQMAHAIDSDNERPRIAALTAVNKRNSQC